MAANYGQQILGGQEKGSTACHEHDGDSVSVRMLGSLFPLQKFTYAIYGLFIFA